jgi:hypothetical protein
MAKLSVKPGSTSQTVYVKIFDSASSTGAGLTGLAFNTASLTAYYVRVGGSATAITLATLAAANSAWSSGGFKEVDATNMPGLYRLDVPDAVIATGVRSAVIQLKGAASMVPCELEIDLNAEVNLTHSNGTAVTNYDGTLAAVTADTDITFPATDAAGNSIPDDARYEYALLQLVGGTGAGQMLFLTAKTGVRKFGFVDAYTPVNPSTDTQYVVLGSWRANVTHWINGAVEVPGTTGRVAVNVMAVEGTDASNYFDAQIGTGSGFTTIPWNSAWDAEVRDAVHDGTVLSGTVESTGTTTTNIVIKTMDPTLTVTDQVKGRVILFKTNTTTAALRGQGAPIDGSTTTAITLAAGDALTTAPAEDDAFVIV